MNLQWLIYKAYLYNMSPPIKKPSLRFRKNQVKTRIYFNGEMLPKIVIENQIWELKQVLRGFKCQKWNEKNKVFYKKIIYYLFLLPLFLEHPDLRVLSSVKHLGQIFIYLFFNSHFSCDTWWIKMKKKRWGISKNKMATKVGISTFQNSSPSTKEKFHWIRHESPSLIFQTHKKIMCLKNQCCPSH